MRKQINEVWFDTINIDFLRTAVLVIVGDNAAILKDAAPKIDKELRTDNLVQECIRELLDDDYLYDSTLTAPNATGDVTVFFNSSTPENVSYETMVHEFHHAVNCLCDFRGIDDEETEAYLQEYLFHEMLCKVDDYVAAQKKDKGKPKKST